MGISERSAPAPTRRTGQPLSSLEPDLAINNHCKTKMVVASSSSSSDVKDHGGQMGTSAYLLLEDGSRYDGKAFGAKKCSSGEVGTSNHCTLHDITLATTKSYQFIIGYDS